jgi:shikimate kinase/3-dehydroquinate synthase
VALVGFMAAGKTTLGVRLAERLGRPFRDVDDELERRTGLAAGALLRERGEPAFRELEANAALDLLDARVPAVVALGGGAPTSPRVRDGLREHAFCLHLEIGLEEAWERARRAGDRPLAEQRVGFERRFEERLPLYSEVADAVVAGGGDLDGAVLAAAGVHVEASAHERLGELVPGRSNVALVADARVAGIHGAAVQLALGERLAETHELPAGEAAKRLSAHERLLEGLTLDRDGTLVALGGGSTTDAAGFAAATYLRGVAWAAVPTTLVGQVDAAIGGKTALDLAAGKNLVGAFHWPVRAVIDPVLLVTLPQSERRNGLAEAVKTGLLAGEPLWELPEAELVRRCAAFKAAVCLRDPREEGERAQLNLGHTFAHALEAASGYALAHGDAVALGLLAALRLSGLDTSPVDEMLRPRPVRVDRERAWKALARDKKARDGQLRLVLLDAPGRPRTHVELPEADVRAALDALIHR